MVNLDLNPYINEYYRGNCGISDHMDNLDLNHAQYK